ncbi:MAG: hypothetical protein M3Q29_13015 [Chloroflexota bacterium]|nr:hypothetical protein [Chloroflexota bacterium]
MRKLYLLLVMVLALGLTGVVRADESGGEMHEAMAKLEMVEESGYHGKAHLKSMGDDMTHVKIELEGMSEDMSMPAHIHMGTMEDYGPPKYALNNVEDGMSETEVEVSLEELLSEEHVIAVHMSEEDLTVVAVGDIMKMESEDEQTEDGQHEDEQTEDGQHEDMESEDEQTEDGQHEDMPEDMPETGAGGMADSSNSTPVAGLALVGLILAAGTLLVSRSRSI